MPLNSLFLILLEVTLTCSALILVYTLLSVLLQKKYRARLRYLLLLAITIRLILPFNFQFGEAPIQMEPPEDVVIRQELPSSQTDTSPLQTSQVSWGRTGTAQDGQNTRQSNAANGMAGYAAFSNEAVPEAGEAEAIVHWFDPLALVSWIWFSGMAICLLIQFFLYFSSRRSLLRWCLPAPERTLELLDRIRREFGIRRKIRVYVCRKPTSPMVIGILRPAVILPEREFDEATLSMILQHELTHAKHHDVFFKLLLLLARALHWFNPFVWWLCREAERTIEFACDEAVLTRLGTSRSHDYGLALLNTMQQAASRTPLSTAFSDSARGLKRRFRNILSPQNKRRGAAILLVAVLFVSLGGGLVACRGAEQTNRELTIYVERVEYHSYLYEVIHDFENSHPGVQLNIVGPPEEYQDGMAIVKKRAELKAQLEAGTGPDLILFPHFSSIDLQKAMGDGMFYDLNTFLHRDPTYRPEDYNRQILRAGQHRGKQYILPLFYTLPILLTTEEALAETGFDAAKCVDYPSFLKEAGRYADLGNRRRLFSSKDFGCYTLSHCTGLSIMDYENRRPTVDSEQFRRIRELYGAFQSYDHAAPYSSLIDPARYSQGVLEESILFWSPFENFGEHSNGDDGAGSNLIVSAMEMAGAGLTPRMVPIRTVNGGLEAVATLSAAIRANSQNRQNAYDFIRLLMEPEVQGGPQFLNWLPMRTESSVSRLDNAKQFTGYFSYIGNLSPCEELPDEFRREYLSLIEQVECATFFGNSEWNHFPYLFTPVYEGEETWQECTAKATAELNAYLKT